MAYGDREPRGGIGVDRPTLLAAVEVVGEALRRRPAGARQSARDFLAGLPIDEGAREAITARIEVSCSDTADQVEAGELQGVARIGQASCPSIAGGNQRLAVALAGGLGSAVHLRSPVDHIRWDDRRVVVSARGTEVEAEACVVSVPASVMDRIAFEPVLPSDVAGALGSITYGRAAKLFVPLAEPAPPSAVLSVPERYWTWTALGDGGRPQPVASCFAGSGPALDALDVASGPETWLASLGRLRPDLPLLADEAVLSTWDDDPWVAGAYSTTPPDRPDQDVLCEPVGPLIFCGEHTAGEFSALMEGGLRSGIRAARDLLAAEGAGG